MATVLDPSLTTRCADTFGNDLVPGSWEAVEKLQLDHVSGENKNALGKRAPSDMAHLVALCPRHHIASGWATSHRKILREYLTSLYG